MFVLSIIKFFLLFPFKHYYLTLLYVLINFVLATAMYAKLKPFYDAKHESSHKKYEYFRRLDKLSFPRILVGFLFLVWPRAIIFALSMLIMAVLTNVGKDIHDPASKAWKDKAYTLCSKIVLFAVGCVLVTEERDPAKAAKIYKKYLGPDFEISYDEPFCAVISNHCSWVESYYFNAKYNAGYVSKKSAQKVPLISHVGRYNKTIYCDRQSEADRLKAVEAIANRQKGLMSGAEKTQLAIYPEGTMSNGTYLIKFKRGAFMTLLPLKVHIEKIDQSAENSLAVAAMDFPLHMVLACCYLWHSVTFLDLPVVKPTEYMYETYKDLGNEKWMIYMNVTKKLMAEYGALKECEATFKPEKLDYLSEIKGKKVKNT